MKIKPYLILIPLLVLFLIGCNEAKLHSVSKPEGLLPEAKMVEVLTDFQLAEAVVNQRAGLRQDVRTKQKQVYADAILKKNNLDPKLFWDSYNYYITQPKVLDTIYAQTLKAIEAKLPAAQEALKKNPIAEPRDAPNVPAILPKSDKKGGETQVGKKK